MKLYVDLKGERHYLVTDDGEAVYVDELEEDGRVTGYLEQAIDTAERLGRYASRNARTAGVLEVQTHDPDE